MASTPSSISSASQSEATSTTNVSTTDASNGIKKSRGRGTAIVVYMLFLGSVLTVVTAPIGVLLAHMQKNDAEEWVASHLQFQIRTFWLGVLGGVVFTAIWHLLGWVGLSAMAPWALGYLYFTACLIWLVGRCGVGITHLTNNRPVANPRSLAFGGARVTLADR